MKKQAYTSRAGFQQFRPILSASRLEETCDNTGFCLACGNDQHGCEPDMRKGTCHTCSAPKVYGLEELVMNGLAIVR